MQASTFSVNFEEGQKHPASLLEWHLGIVSHVFMHFGNVSGHETGTMGGLRGAGLVVTAVGLETGTGAGDEEGHTVVDVV